MPTKIQRYSKTYNLGGGCISMMNFGSRCVGCCCLSTDNCNCFPDTIPKREFFGKVCDLGDLQMVKLLYKDEDEDGWISEEVFLSLCRQSKLLEISKFVLFLNSIYHNNVPENLLNEAVKVNVFETKQENLIKIYQSLIIS